MEGKLKTDISLHDLADELVRQMKSLLERAKTEEDLKVEFEKILDSIRSELELQYVPRYEKSAYKGRSDAVHGQLIIEYEAPRSLFSKSRVDHAYKQLVDYLKAEMEVEKTTKMVGVGFDGEQIFFVKYEGESEFPIDPSKFVLRGPYEFNTESAITFLIHLRALSRLPLNADNLAQKFGPQSHSAQKMLSALVNALRHWGNQTRMHTFFDEWRRLFGIVYGEQFTKSLLQKEAESLSQRYKVGGEPTFHELLFCIHTYFVFLIKLIAAEILTLRETSLGSSFASELVHMKDDELRRALDDIEKGGIYARKGISNFLEGDFFQWYLDAFDSPELRDAIREIARGFSEFEPATSTIDPTSIMDLLKKLYQYLVPKGIRHSLGEYYTPDWLAELLLDEVGYDGDLSKRLLDPACGSGTFLVLAIQRAKERGQREKRENLPPVEIAKRIVANIWGFDLNPLAVIAARTNYLFALGDLIKELPRIEIPIYLTDSVLTPTRTSRNLFGGFLEVSTSVGKFQIPVEWIRNGGFLLSIAAPLIEEMIKNEYSVDEAITRLESAGLIVSNNKQVVENFYIQILKLEEQGKNGIWVRLLKNTFAPVAAGKFDFVVGNPPWVIWEIISEDYRKATSELWKDYKLFPIKKTYGLSKPDLSMLFVYASADYYLKNGGKLGFLITQEVFKSKGAGEGFRRFQIGDREYLKVLKAHDLATIQPFEEATNKTALIVLKKGEKTKYPLPYILWTKERGVGRIPTNIPLRDAIVFLQKKKLVAEPIDSSVGPWHTISLKEKELLKIKGQNYYKAQYGVETKPYGVFWLKINRTLSDGTMKVSNLTEKGKLKIWKIEEIIEGELVYPALRGADIQRWGMKNMKNGIFILLTHHRDGEPIEQTQMKTKLPRTYNYLVKFREKLLSIRAKSTKRKREEKIFYAMFGVNEGTFSNFKVVWKRMTNDLVAAVVSQVKTPIGWKAVIPLETTAFIPTDNESEAHYLCAIINSKLVRDFIKSFSSAGRGFGTPSVMEYVGIPKYDPSNDLHKKLAGNSKECHRLKAEGKKEEIKKLENENDELVKKLFGTTSERDGDDLG